MVKQILDNSDVPVTEVEHGGFRDKGHEVDSTGERQHADQDERYIADPATKGNDAEETGEEDDAAGRIPITHLEEEDGGEPFDYCWYISSYPVSAGDKNLCGAPVERLLQHEDAQDFDGSTHSRTVEDGSREQQNHVHQVLFRLHRNGEEGQVLLRRPGNFIHLHKVQADFQKSVSVATDDTQVTRSNKTNVP